MYFWIVQSVSQAKFPDGGLVSGSRQFCITAPVAFKYDALFERGQNQLENRRLALLIEIRDTLCRKTFEGLK